MLINYDSKKEWTKTITNREIAYPCEYIIRMFKGKYPMLNMSALGYAGKKLCDIGCGDGRNLGVFKECGFDEVVGIEITEEIVEKTRRNIDKAGFKDIRLECGSNSNIPFADKYFDYIVSWNACYYMGIEEDFDKYVEEFARIVKKGGTFVFSIPMPSCFIYKGADEVRQGYMQVKNDPFNIRNGEILRIFKSTEEIEHVFGKYFNDFVFGKIVDDCFGYNYHWFIGICKKKH